MTTSEAVPSKVRASVGRAVHVYHADGLGPIAATVVGVLVDGHVQVVNVQLQLDTTDHVQRMLYHEMRLRSNAFCLGGLQIFDALAQEQRQRAAEWATVVQIDMGRASGWWAEWPARV